MISKFIEYVATRSSTTIAFYATIAYLLVISCFCLTLYLLYKMSVLLFKKLTMPKEEPQEPDKLV